MPGVQLTDTQRELILENRASAIRVARSLIRRSNYFLYCNEIQSIADIALCEAARSFDSKRGSSFMSYLFLFIKGSVMSEIRKGFRNQIVETKSKSSTSRSMGDRNGESEYREPSYSSQELPEQVESPEELLGLKELRVVCRSALRALPPLERSMIISIDLLGSNITQYAQSIGYSRPYLSAVRQKAIKKMHPYFEAYLG